MTETQSPESLAGELPETEVPATTLRRTVLAGIVGNVMEPFSPASPTM